MSSSIPGLFLAGSIALFLGLPAFAADPQSYRVDLVSTGNGALDATLHAASQLEALRKSAPVGPFGLIVRARGEVERLRTVLESYGYYQAAVNITIEGLALGSPGIADTLAALPKGHDARIAVSFTLGVLYRLGKITIDGSIPPSAAGAWTLQAGVPAVADEVLGAGTHLETTLQEEGYAFAKVEPPIAYEDPVLPQLNVTFKVEAGPRLNIGDIHLEGLVRVHEKLIRRLLLVHTGQRYSPSAIDAARRDLLTLGPFAAISVVVGKAVDDTGGVPITFVFVERKRHGVSLNAAYSSDLGGSGGVTWSDRNVFGNAEQLNVAASIINLGGTGTTNIGYDTSAKLSIPDVGARDQSLQFSLSAIKQSLIAYNQQAVTAGISMARKLSSVWTASAGLTATQEQIYQDAVPRNYTLVATPLTLAYDSTHLASPLDDPLHGMRNSFSVTPTQSLGVTSATFIISQIKLAAYVDLNEWGWSDPGREVLALRVLAGLAQGACEFCLPPDQRFYAGGSGTIRGYSYQDVGTLFTGTTIPVGGTAIEAGTVEFRMRFGSQWGGAIFADAGQVGSTLRPVAADIRVGVGFGVRYYTAIGPLRIDLAAPTRRDSTMIGTQRQNIDPAFQVYIGLGQAF